MLKDKTVVIVGGGPTGLFLGLCLAQYKIDFIILERRTERDKHSKSIGIHPPSLELLAQVGLAERFLAAGVKIKNGVAFIGTERVGEISFDETGHEIPFVLTLPQYQTEELLEMALLEIRPTCIRKGIKALSIDQKKKSVSVRWEENDVSFETRCEFLVGCDGKNSEIRRKADLKFHGAPYPDTYVMADFPDNTPWPETGALFFHHEGIVESFPLPDNIRRWVVKTDEFQSDVTAVQVAKAVQERTGRFCDAEHSTMQSGFGVQHFLADRFYDGNRIILAGDAAHVISPIGGQGMNLGWMDAWELGEIFGKARLNGFSSIHPMLEKYSNRRKKMTKIAMRSAFFNMAMGRKTSLNTARRILIKLVLTPFFRKILIRRFTMQGILNTSA